MTSQKNICLQNKELCSPYYAILLLLSLLLLNTLLLKVNTRNSDINWNLSHQEMGCVVFKIYMILEVESH